MNTSAVEASLGSAPDLAGLEPVEKITRRWPMLLGGALTLLMIGALAHAAARDDIDLWVHLGDYLYEYAKGGYAPEGGAVAGRWPEPVTEMIHLTDYRLRYASYRSDPDLQELHRLKPMLVQMDDHESANNSREMSAQNNQPEYEGLWSDRKAAALQVFKEWMPVSETPWGAYDIGGLATLFRTESRLIARSDEPDIDALFKAANPAAALAQFRDGPLQDPARTMLGTEQEAWLAHVPRVGPDARP